MTNSTAYRKRFKTEARCADCNLCKSLLMLPINLKLLKWICGEKTKYCRRKLATPSVSFTWALKTQKKCYGTEETVSRLILLQDCWKGSHSLIFIWSKKSVWFVVISLMKAFWAFRCGINRPTVIHTFNSIFQRLIKQVVLLISSHRYTNYLSVVYNGNYQLTIWLLSLLLKWLPWTNVKNDRLEPPNDLYPIFAHITHT